MKKLDTCKQTKIVGGSWDDFIDGVCAIGGIGTAGGLGLAAAAKLGVKVVLRVHPVTGGILAAIDIGCLARDIYTHW